MIKKLSIYLVITMSSIFSMDAVAENDSVPSLADVMGMPAVAPAAMVIGPSSADTLTFAATNPLVFAQRLMDKNGRDLAEADINYATVQAADFVKPRNLAELNKIKAFFTEGKKAGAQFSIVPPAPVGDISAVAQVIAEESSADFTKRVHVKFPGLKVEEYTYATHKALFGSNPKNLADLNKFKRKLQEGINAGH